MSEGENPPQPQPAPRASPDMPPAAPTQAPPSAPPTAPASGPASSPGNSSASATGGFDFNHPTIISLLYLSAFALGITGIVAVVLAYVWKGEAHAEWESSHFAYHIRTFWLWLIGMVVGAVLLILAIGFLIWLATAVLVVVRCVLALLNAQKLEPMPNPDTWLA